MSNLIKQVLSQIDFHIGKKTLKDILLGKLSNNVVRQNSLHTIKGFGSLAYHEEAYVLEEINKLIKEGEINEIYEGSATLLDLAKKETTQNFTKIKGVEIDDKDKLIFSEFEFFLSKFNDDQKKAIISPHQKIVCIAGAGSGKTTVLSKRIEFLIKFKNTNPKDILAITFTRKARQEMQSRLNFLQNIPHIETFNSFSEKILNRLEKKYTGMRHQIMGNKDRYSIFSKSLQNQNILIDDLIDLYFTKQQISDKPKEFLINILLKDIFSLIENRKIKGNLQEKEDNLINNLTKEIIDSMREANLRDYTDQVLDTLSLMRNHPESIPHYEHILVDEYQDVNDIQVSLLKILSPKNIFYVGDPRQSIFGWRGSDLSYVLDLAKKETTQTIVLTKNYRSSDKIVELSNQVIRDMQLPDVKSSFSKDEIPSMINHSSEESERQYMLNEVSKDKTNDSIFILARTNKQIEDLSNFFKLNKIKHNKRDEFNQDSKERIILSTIHSIKGMEADKVYLLGCNDKYFPCKTPDTPLSDLYSYDYDKEEEEKRLLYVALTRARNSLILTYNGKRLTPFINSSTKRYLNILNTQKKLSNQEIDLELLTNLKKWRYTKSQILNTDSFMILTNKSIEDLTLKKPTSIYALESVYGFGSRKIQSYGEEIIKIIKEYV